MSNRSTETDNRERGTAGTLTVEPQPLERMRAHAEADYPRECCGFVYGKDAAVRHISRIRRARNASEEDRKRRFRIEPEEYREAEEYADREGLDLLGVYHSHPDHPAEPSEHDRAVAMPWFSYLILSVHAGEAVECRSWQLNEQRQFEEESLTTE